MIDCRVLPITNRDINPSFEVVQGGAAVNSVNRSRINTTAAAVGSWFMRNIRTTTDFLTPSYRWAATNTTASPGATIAQRRSCYVRTSINRQVAISNGGTPPAGDYRTVLLNVWTRIASSVIQSAANADYVWTDAMVVDETLHVDGIMVTWLRDALAADFNYIDGSFPGCKWLGTVGNSASVGFPRGWN